jgi:hypothetical protein
VYSLSFPCSILTLRFTSEFQELWEPGLDTRAIIMVIRTTATTGRTILIDHIRTTTPVPHTIGITGIGFTIAITAIIITATIKLT